MRILGPLQHIHSITAYSCASGGGRTEEVEVPILTAAAEWPESELEAILLCSDMQFYHDMNVPKEDRILLGHIVAQELAGMATLGQLPPASRTAAILGGDFYAIPTLVERGGLGDVHEVWMDFAERFRWVAGVAGNHDLFYGDKVRPEFLEFPNIHFLDGDRLELDGLRLGGISGIPGPLKKAWRYSFEDFAAAFDAITEDVLDLLVLHAGPHGRSAHRDGLPHVNECLRECEHPPGMVAFGHRRWAERLEEDPDRNPGCQALSLDGAVILLQRPGSAKLPDVL